MINALEGYGCISITHRKTALNVISKINSALDDNYITEIVSDIDERIVIRTCSRFEVYLYDSNLMEKLEIIRDKIVEKINRLNVGNILVDVYKGSDAIVHLIKVASGLDSIIVGETEILDQVKLAYRKALSKDNVKYWLRLAFRRAFKAREEIEKKTSIGSRKIGFPEVAVELASSLDSGLKDKSVAIVGAGHAASKMAYLVSQYSVKEFVITNRTLAKANLLAKKLGARTLNLERFIDSVDDYDVILVALSGNNPIKISSTKRTHVIDISVPPAILPNGNTVYHDIESVASLAKSKVGDLSEDIKVAEGIIKDHVKTLAKIAVKNAIRSEVLPIIKEIEELRVKGIKRAANSIMKGKPVEEVLNRMSKSLIKKIMNRILNIADNVEESAIFELIKRKRC